MESLAVEFSILWDNSFPPMHFPALLSQGCQHWYKGYVGKIPLFWTQSPSPSLASGPKLGKELDPSSPVFLSNNFFSGAVQFPLLLLKVMAVTSWLLQLKQLPELAPALKYKEVFTSVDLPVVSSFWPLTSCTTAPLFRKGSTWNTKVQSCIMSQKKFVGIQNR